ncbi:acetylornithine deacetylase [Pseudidiomarina donghaiensis]|uniref:Acetylornithine deacetylase n=1 Tax=Pseudidiomarina donghaiensis TaxID=519452 RepID=A0A432XEH8_9GAMM|nr:acetylornithine deacetylase [Pseudidiomarina donghaiensis]RUO47151.1 acetylornithine deacetylase [Pseudidiomarina donghaiensis]SFV23713.1 acetylornithine deacetylase [Pseudidiomarina donghaiensis]
MPQLPSFIQMYRELIATPSVSCLDPSWDTSNKAVIEKLAQWLDSLGFQIDIHELDHQSGKYNLLAHYIPEGASEGGLMLAGHTDTVPWDEGRWTQDPFKLREDNGCLYGLGSADMKGFFAFVLEALRGIDLKTLTKPLYILATADEETTMAGARELDAFGHLKPEFAIIGEPTSMTPVTAHKGHLTEAVRVTGKSGHSSNPAGGVNAIEIMHDVITELRTVQREFQQRFNDATFEVPYPTLNFGAIHGGDAANRICACCELHIDMRPLPGMNIDDMYGLIDDRLREVKAKYPGAVCLQHMHEPIPGYRCDNDSDIVQLAHGLTGNAPEVANYCTEAPFVQGLGCQTIIMGPGNIAQAHQPDEYIQIDEIAPAQRHIRDLIRSICQA